MEKRRHTDYIRHRYGHLCTVNGAVWTPQGRIFDGSDDKIVIPAHSSIAMGDGHTLALWVKVLTWDDYIRIWGKYVDDDNRISWYLNPDGTWITCNYRSGGAYQITTSTQSFSMDDWQFIAATASPNGNSFVLYHNRKIAGTYTSYTLPDTSSSDLILGARGDDTQYINAILGGVFVFSRELTYKEVLNLEEVTRWRYR